MNLISVPSLEQIAFRKVATLVWYGGNDKHPISQSEFRALLKVDKNFKITINVKTFSSMIREKIPELELPESLKTKLSYFIEPVARQMKAWSKFRDTYSVDSSFKTKRQKSFCWTPFGTIDYRRTGEMLIQKEGMEVEERIKTAVVYGLENEFNVLKDKVEMAPDMCFASYFISCQKEAIAKLDKQTNGFCETDAISYNECAFRYSALSGNLGTTRHFLKKLSPHEKDRSLVMTANYVTERFNLLFSSFRWCPFTDVFVFLLSVMNKEQQTSMFKNKQQAVMTCFFRVPWQHCFLEIYDHILPFLDDDAFRHLLMMIVWDFDNCEYGDTEHIFYIVWQKTPVSYKKKNLECFGVSYCMGNIFSNMNEDLAKMFLNDIIDIMGNECILAKVGTEICQCFIECNNMYLFRYFIETCKLSKDIMMELKKVLATFLSNELVLKMNYNLEKASEIIDECIGV